MSESHFKNSQLFSLFSLLGKDELRELAKWLESPIHNQREDVVLLFKHLRKNLLAPAKLSPTLIWNAVYPHQPYENKQWRYVQSFLYQHILDYLAYRQWQNDEPTRRLFLVRALRNHRANKSFYKEFDEASAQLEQQQLRDARYHYHFYHLQYEKYEYEISQNRTTAQEFSTFSGQLTLFFVISLLKQRCAMFSHQTVMSAKDSDEIPDGVLEDLALNYREQSPVVFLYFSIYQLLKKYSEATYHDVRQSLPLHLNLFHSNEQRDLILLTINFCVRQYNEGNKTFLQEALEWYQVGLDSKALFENGVLSRFTFKNMVVAAIVIEDFKRAENIVYQYQKHLDESYRQNMVNYCLSLIYFRQSEYEKAMNLLQQSDFDDVLHNLDARRMLLRIYFDRGEMDALLSHIDSFKIFISRQKNLGYHRTNYLNLIHYTKKIIQNQENRKQLAAIRKEVSENAAIAERAWLLSVLEG